MKNTSPSDVTAIKITWRGHVSRLADKLDVRKQRVEYRARRLPCKAVGGAMHRALRSALLTPRLARCEISRMPRWRVINS